MKNRYEALLVLNTQGKDDDLKDIVDRLESEFQKEGAQIEQVQKMDKRQFSYVGGRPRRRLLRQFHLSRRLAADHETALQIQARPGSLSPALPAAAREKRAAGEKESRRREVDSLELAHGQSQQSPPDGKPDARSRSALHAERHRGCGTRDCGQSHLHRRKRGEARRSHLR